jgi:hypothetical protein
MKLDARAVLAALALVLSACQGSGLDSGMGGMGDMEPPVSQPGPIGASPGGMTGGMGGQMAGPQMGMNGQEELANPGATLAPNEAQYPVGQGPSGMKCPMVQMAHQTSQQYNCTVAFNVPAPSPSPSGSPDPKAKATTAPTPSPSPSPSSSSDDSDDSDASDTPTPSPTPPGTITMLVEPLPSDVPSMTNPDPRFMRITPLVAVRLQSDMDFKLNGGATAQYTLPQIQYTGRVFALQLYNETYIRGKRTDQLLGNYGKFTTPPNSSTVQFTFSIPQVTVRHGSIWLLAMYGAQLPPGSTPTPSPTPADSPSPSASPSASP